LSGFLNRWRDNVFDQNVACLYNKIVTTRHIPSFQESAVIYFSPEDNCWIANGLVTDQVGTGVDMGRALADLICGVDRLIQLAREDETIEYIREAPAEIRAMTAHSKPLPREIYEVAHKIARGEWPSEIEPTFMAMNDNVTYTAEIPEFAAPEPAV
jgi:hypothetical protein